MSTSSSNERISALEKLVHIEAMLIAILVHLPPKSVFMFKCVSKTWNRILAEPFFLESHYKVARAKEQFVGYGGEQFLAFINSSMAHYASLDVLRRRSSYLNPSDTLPLTQNKYNFNQMVPRRFGDIYHSYNGLILCLEEEDRKVCHIINPLTRMWILLPRLEVRCIVPIGLTWEENICNLIPIYKVVTVQNQVSPEKAKTVVIHTYCSKSGKWAKSILIGKEDFRIDSVFSPIVSNGVFYWYASGGKFAVYDTNRDEKHVQFIKLPNSTREGALIPSTVSSQDDTLWFGMKDWREFKMRFWILPKDKQQDGYKKAITVERNEWISMPSICISSFCLNLDATVASDPSRARKLELLGLIPSYPVLAVFSNYQNIYLYNVESKCVELVSDCPSSLIDPHNSYCLLPYVESLSLSSYALSTTYY